MVLWGRASLLRTGAILSCFFVFLGMLVLVFFDWLQIKAFELL
jgi:hypothetical protein